MTVEKPRSGEGTSGEAPREEREQPGEGTKIGSSEFQDLRRNLHSLSIAMRELLEVRPLDGLTTGEISPDQLRVLRLVFFNEGSRVGQVAEGLGIKPSSASLILDRLEARGYIARYSDSDDRRITRLKPTAEGLKIFEEAERLINERFDTALRSFDGPKIDQLNSLIGDFIRGMMEGETIFASLCFHCGILASGTCVLNQKYEHCPYLSKIGAGPG